MSQPAKVKNLRAVSKGRVVPDGPKADVKWELLENNEYLSGEHHPDDVRAAHDITVRLPQIEQLEREGRFAKAEQLRRDVNLATEAQWAVRSSWCPTCLNVYHNCQCPVEYNPDKVEVEFIDSITSRMGTKEERKARKKAQVRAKREARKAEKRNNTGHV
jgi:hypothetical protein